MTDEGHWVQEIKENDPIQEGIHCFNYVNHYGVFTNYWMSDIIFHGNK
ncbi:hypothetical protein SAMN04488689_102608 [Paenibacillus sp. cl6col]|nr:hypothetical protein SAMN04488689_102608 [Paenibacillus sp. cl6col]